MRGLRRIVFLGVGLCWLGMIGCGSSEGKCDLADLLEDGTREVFEDVMDAADVTEESLWTVENAGGTVIFSHVDRELFELVGVEWLDFEPKVSMVFGFFDFLKSGETSTRSTIRGDGVVRFGHGDFVDGFLETEELESGALRVTIRAESTVDGIRAIFSRSEGDRFWGFGEQYNSVDFDGWQVPIWVQEQGVGRAPEPPSPFIGTYTDSYFPMPWFLDPEAGKGFLVENTEYSLFDLGKTDETEWFVECWTEKTLTFLLFPGPGPMEVVEQLTAVVGRAKTAPPDWALSGVWLAAQGGTEVVQQKVQTALDAEIPVTAVWAQDWLGRRGFGGNNFGVKYHWTWDPEHYPELEQAISDWNAQGVRFLGYFNPFVVPDFEQFEPGKEAGYLVKEPNGKAYVFMIVTFEGGLLDVFNPDAADWFSGFAQDAVDMGMSGWMADFGEWLPFDGQIGEGIAPRQHNLYPTRWHEINRTVLEDTYPDGDFVMLTRSGYTGEQGVAQVVWAGDQEANWEESDGFPTVVTAGLTLSMAGIPFFTHDIGGFSGGPRTGELFHRWTELGAFTPVMRTHEGLQKDENHQFNSDPETLEHFRHMARIHEAMMPVWKELSQEALDSGHPLIRHTALVDPEWAPSFDAHQQWMLGNDFVVAPVLEESSTTVTVHLPDGEWEHLLTSESLDGRTTTEVDAPIGTPAVFVRKGTWTNVVETIRNL